MSRLSPQDIQDFPDPQHARWAQAATILPDVQPAIVRTSNRNIAPNSPINIRHPLYNYNIRDWERWRTTYDGGEDFIQRYVIKFSNREDPNQYRKRKRITPIAAFAAAAIDEIKNSIFERTADISRQSGPASYQQAIRGELGGVDLHGATMNWFIGHNLISELLVMRKVGVYVDSPQFGPTLADKGNKHPYLYPYRAEDILSWDYDAYGNLTNALLRDYTYEYDSAYGLPAGEKHGYRWVFLNPTTGFINIQLFDDGGNPLTSEPREVQIREHPLVPFELTKSLMKDICNHQIALTNLESSDMSYALQGNYPFYIEQFDPKNSSPIIRGAQAAYTALTSNPPTASNPETTTSSPATGTCLPGIPNNPPVDADLGVSQGRRYPIGVNAPQFINPSSEPLKVSMEKQDRLKEDIRKLIKIALSTVQSKAISAESKSIDQQSLEAGLANIGLELEHGERRIARIWAMYEGESNNIPTVHYPERWSLKSIDDIQKEIQQHQQLREDIPSKTFKREMNKHIVLVSLGSKLSNQTLDTINQELDVAKGGTSDSKTINTDVQNGLVSQATASSLRGYPDSEVQQAANDHAARLARIALAQTSGKALDKVAEKEAVNTLTSTNSNNPAARGLPDLSGSPAADAAAEKIGKKGRGTAQ